MPVLLFCLGMRISHFEVREVQSEDWDGRSPLDLGEFSEGT